MDNFFGKKNLIILGLTATLLIFAWTGSAEARHEHIVYFKDTPQELNIYKIHGRFDGPTMMIIGGIQGDEPGGFLSADLYIDLDLKKGNLIVVPRANFNSILRFMRGPNGDMNRKFGRETEGDADAKIVRILEELMGDSDVLLNLHDGWGFYRPKYVDQMANPFRYGQSIIADCAEYKHPKTGHRLELQKTAEKVIEIINSQIEDDRYHFHFMNTRTDEASSPYAEQRASATFYALTHHGIPAFGVETSKNLPSLEMKVHQHNLAVNAFMDVFGLVPEQPRLFLEKPILKYMVIAVNGQVPVAVADGQTLHLAPGDTIEVIHVEANYERGLSVDIQGFGTINDFRQSFPIDKPTFIVAQKDHIKFGRIPISLDSDRQAPQTPSPKPPADEVFQVKAFIIEVDGQRREVPVGGTLRAVDGDRIKVLDIVFQGPPPQGMVVNFKGFVSDPVNNTGEDRGVEINTAKDLLARYSLSKDKKIYEVTVEKGKTVLAKMTVDLQPPNLDYLVLQTNNGPQMRVKNGGSVKIKPGDLVQVLDLKTNVPSNRGVQVLVQGQVSQTDTSDALLSFKAEKSRPLTLIVTRDGLTLGKIVLQSG